MDRQAQEASWWRAWRQLDLSWDGLSRHPGHDGTLQDYWRNETGRLIAEPGSDRLWTRFHCPFVFSDGTPSPKAFWSAAEWTDLHTSLRTRLALGTAEKPCLLTGAILDGLSEPEPAIPEADGFLWLRADYAYFRDGIDLSRNGLGLADFRGAWFGGKAVLEGARAVTADFAGAFYAERMPLAQAAAPVRPTLSLSHPARSVPEPAPFRPLIKLEGLTGRMLVALPLVGAVASALWYISHHS